MGIWTIENKETLRFSKIQGGFRVIKIKELE